MKRKRQQRTPRNYDGVGVTNRRLSDLLPAVMAEIGAVYQDRPDLILAAWPQVVGGSLSPMTQAVAFKDGVLFVKVKNSTLHSLLSQRDKPRVLNRLRSKFPKTKIRNIVFRMS